MITVKFFGIARVKFGEKSIDLEASNIEEMLDIIAKKYDKKSSEIKQFLIYVNDVNIFDLKKYKTPLKSGDVVMLFSPASGG